MKKRNRVFAGLLLAAFLCGPAVSAAELSVADTDLDDLTDTVSMSFDGALLKDVLLLFSQQSGLNFIASQDVENKKVTVFFENVSVKDALDAIVTANGLSYSKKPGSDIFVVSSSTAKPASVELITKVIRLKYMRLSASPLDVGGQVTIDDLKTIAQPVIGDSSSESSSSSSDTSTSSSSSSSTPSDKGADKLVAKLLSPQGKLAVDSQTNSLIVTDTPAKVEQIEKILEEIDVPPSQVILEVHVLEVKKGLTSDIGIEWGGTNGSLASFTGGTRTTPFPFTGFNGRNKGPQINEFVDTAGDPITTQLQLGTISATNFKATLHYLESDTDTKVIARPRVLTQNNEAAVIRVVTGQTIGVNQTTTNSTPPTISEVPERTEVGVTMRMTPQINGDDSVLLFLEPSVTTVATSTAFPQFLDPTTRLVRTMARVKDNQTLVIGGLIQGDESITKRKFPLLGDIPFLGKALFRYDATRRTDTELLVFVTPHIARGATSLGKRSATAKGEDVLLRRMLGEFVDREMGGMTDSFQDFEKNEQPFFTTEQELVRASEKRYSNPVLNKQMTQALDAMSPQIVDTGLVDAQMNQSLDALTNKKYRT